MALAPAKLLSQLERWLKAGLISPEQRNAIVAHESAQSRPFNPMAWLAAAGGFCVSLGIILLIAHNWEDLGPLLKQSAFILALILAAFASDRLEGKPWLGPGLMLIWLGLPLAGIGLWGQIYHLSGDAFKPLLVWLFLSAPIAWLARHRVAAFAHTAGLGAAAFVGAFSQGTWLNLTRNNWFHQWGNSNSSFDPLRWSLNFTGILLIWALALWQAHSRLRIPERVALLIALAVFLASLGLAGTPLQCEQDWLALLMVCGLGVMLWFASWLWGLRGTALREMGFGLSAAFCYGLSFVRFMDNPGHSTPGGMAWALFWGLGGLLLAAFGPWRKMQLSKRWLGPLTALLPLTLILSGLIGLPSWAVGLAANFALAALCAAWMFESAAQSEKVLLNWSTFILGLLIFTRFVDYLGSFLKSGLGFIASGLAFLALAWALNQGRKALLDGAGKQVAK